VEGNKLKKHKLWVPGKCNAKEGDEELSIMRICSDEEVKETSQRLLS